MCYSYQTLIRFLRMFLKLFCDKMFHFIPPFTPSGLPPSLAGALQVVDSPLLRQQVEAQRLGIKHLKNENNRLKVHHWCYYYHGIVLILAGEG